MAGYNVHHQNKVAELVDLFASTLKLEAERLYRSGLIDPEDFDPDHYVLAKILITAAIARTGNDFAPLHDKNLMQQAKNLSRA